MTVVSTMGSVHHTSPRDSQRQAEPGALQNRMISCVAGVAPSSAPFAGTQLPEPRLLEKVKGWR